MNDVGYELFWVFLGYTAEFAQQKTALVMQQHH